MADQTGFKKISIQNAAQFLEKKYSRQKSFVSLKKTWSIVNIPPQMEKLRHLEDLNVSRTPIREIPKLFALLQNLNRLVLQIV